MKLFEQEIFNEENGYTTNIIELADSEISDITNSYGMWIESSRFELDESNFEQNEDGTFNLTEDYDETDNLNLLPATWDLRKLTADERNIIIELSKYSIDNSDEADSNFVYEIEIKLSEDGEYFLDINEGEPTVIGKKYSYWDGNNWETIVLSSELYEVEIKDVTNKYSENWESKELIYTINNYHGRYFEFYVLNLNDTNVLLIKNNTAWQGELNTFEILEDLEDIQNCLFNKVDKETIQQYFK